MLTFFEGMRSLTLTTIMARLLFGVISAGFVGLGRTIRHNAAGFRTHILTCIGACIATMTGQYLTEWLGLYTDMTRIAAQVVAGVGFIGGGAIITTGQKVRGLTTATGLWAIAIVGLCYGAGFIEGGIMATVLILFIENVLSGVDRIFARYSSRNIFYVQYKGRKSLERVQNLFRVNNALVESLEFERIAKASEKSEKEMCAIIKLKVPKTKNPEALIEDIRVLNGITAAEIL